MRNRKILVTRPAHQARGLCERLRAAGAEPVLFPVLAIEALPDAVPDCVARIQNCDLLIFVSANAVAQCAPHLPSRPRFVVAAVGAATARALGEHGIEPVLQPSRFTTEGLLELPELEAARLTGRDILIVRGAGGRETLAETLRARGAKVSYAEVYRRIRPDFDAAAHPWIANGELDAILLSSAEGLENLRAMLQDPPWLYSKPLVVISPRLAEIAATQGFRRVTVAPRADDEGLFAALQQVAYEPNRDPGT